MRVAAADRTRETSLWGWLKRAADKFKKWDVQRIENLVAEGTPDVEGCVLGETFWTELKVAYQMAGDFWRVKITVPQVRRARARRRAGGRSWVLVRLCIEGGNEHYLVDGFSAEELLEPVTRERLQQLTVLGASQPAEQFLKTMAGQ